MDNGFEFFINVAPVAIVILIVAILTVVPYRKEPAARPLLWYLGLCVWLLVTNIGELIAPAGALTVFFAKLEYVAFMYIPIAWLSFSLRFTGWITKLIKPLILIAIVGPAVGILLVFTNEFHGLHWSKIYFYEWKNLSVLKPQYGPLYWVAFVYSWLSIATGCIIIFRSYLKGETLYHRQSLWIVGGTLLPAITNILNLTRQYHGIMKDFTPIGFAASGIFFLIGMYFHRLFWIMPVSRSVIIQEIDVGILVLDRRGRIVDHNRRVDELLSLDTVMVGKDYRQFPFLTQLLREIGYEEGVTRNEPQVKQIFINNYFLKCTVQSNGTPPNGTIIMLEDVSAQVALLNENMFVKNEYIKREKLATLGQLAAGLAHEINNPLAYIQSNIRSLNDLLLELKRQVQSDSLEPLFGELAAITSGIYEGFERIEEVARSLLHIARNDPLEGTFEIASIHDCIESTLNIMKIEFQRTTDIVRKFGDVPPVRMQKQAINQVLFNLFTNALQAIEVQYAETGKRGILEIRTGCDETSLWCEIMDTGKPLAPDQVDKIFDLFYTTKTEGVGTGIGLNLCREIVEKKHKGRLFLVSPDPVTFRLELPLGDTDSFSKPLSKNS
ncbi:MAG TPA: histidine kinase N-terminal 7TM domain-containing protein [Termitinemataceae bacterium]|nr:histidine kinase N-terminal 7TM domain-containing protein [Termitinemataceae bacterium]HOM23480.1 histidine kinase N-terminal 7TM domain-containing protein [Termitinemataceae bacterium]HPQ00006.1 histidine kinase N-terminal 7TM domain-containing protein [Termitinemataceae bacterium]